MDQRTIRYFTEVANSGSIRVASEKLHVASSAISRKIGMLEEEFGVQLFDRTAHGMTLTAAGEVYRAYAQSAVLDLERITSEMDRIKGLTRGHIRVATITGMISELGIKAWARFHAQYPDVTLDLRGSGADLVMKALHDRAADIGIGANAKREAGIETVLRISTPLLVVGTPSLLRTSTKPMKLKDVVKAYPFAIPDETFVIRRQIDACAELQSIKVVPALVTNSVEALRDYARFCKGVTFLPALSIRNELESRKLVGMPLSDRILRQATIDILVAAGRKLPPAAVEFLNCLKGIAGELAGTKVAS